jgi:ubiquinone/menaquinone biosynthesis C-methylase UbiE
MAEARHILRLGFVAATSRSTRDFYDRISASYEKIFMDHLVHAEKMISILLEEFAHPTLAAVLDLACGTGFLTRREQEQGFNTIGLDFSHESLRRLKHGARAFPAIQADAAALPFSSASFEAVTCLGAWRHFPDPQRVMDEIRRVLRPGGIFLVGYFPPKLAGLFSTPRGAMGKAIESLYGWITRLLNYTDRISEESERRILQMLNVRFGSVRRVDSGKDSYVLLATSPRGLSPEVSK